MLRKENKALIRKYLKEFKACPDLRTLKEYDYNRLYNDFGFRKYAGLPTRGYKSKLKPKIGFNPENITDECVHFATIKIEKGTSIFYDLAIFSLFTIMYALIFTLFYNLLGLEAVVTSAFAVILGYLSSNVGGR